MVRVLFFPCDKKACPVFQNLEKFPILQEGLQISPDYVIIYDIKSPNTINPNLYKYNKMCIPGDAYLLKETDDGECDVELDILDRLESILKNDEIQREIFKESFF
jgi:hypothetical protein